MPRWRILSAAPVCALLLALSCPAGAQAVLDDIRYAGLKQARAAWTAVDDAEPVQLAVIDGRATLKLPCGFQARPALRRQQWDHAVALDLSGPDKPGIAMELYCPPNLVRQALGVSLSDGQGWASATIERDRLRVGWNSVRICRSQMHPDPSLPDWADIRVIRLTVRRAQAVNTALHVAGLRLLADDPPAAMDRPAAVDRIERKDGQVLQGTVLNDFYGLTTPYGQFVFPAERVVGLRGVGRGTVRLVLTDGQVITGLLTNHSIRLGGQDGLVTELGAREVALLVYRLSAVRPEQAEPAVPLIQVNESRLAFAPEKLALTLRTAHGPIDLPARAMAWLQREPAGDDLGLPPTGDGLAEVPARDSQAEPGPRFRARLAQGSELIGTLAGEMFEVDLTAGKPCAIEVRQLQRVTWPSRGVQPGGDRPAGEVVVALRDGGRAVGRLTGRELTIQTGFGSETIRWSSVQSLSAGRIDAAQVTLKLRGRPDVHGRLRESAIPFALAEGPALNLQAAAIRTITAEPPTAEPPGQAR